MRRRAAALALLPLVVLVSACGGGSDGDDPTIDVPTATTASPSEEPDYTAGENAPDPCTLLTTEQVSTALGARVAAGVKSEDTGPLGGELCLWSSSGAPVRTFQLDLKDGGDISVSGLTPEKLVDQTFTTVPQLVQVGGVGDKAGFGGSTGVVYAKGFYVLTSVGLGTSATASTALRTLTEQAVAALS